VRELDGWEGVKDFGRDRGIYVPSSRRGLPGVMGIRTSISDIGVEGFGVFEVRTSRKKKEAGSPPTNMNTRGDIKEERVDA